MFCDNLKVNYLNYEGFCRWNAQFGALFTVPVGLWYWLQHGILPLQLKTWHHNCPSPPTVSNWTSWTNPFVFPIIRLLMILIKSISSNWTPLYSGYLCNTIVFSEVYSMPPNLSFSSNLLNVNTPFPLIQFQCLNIEWIYWQTYSLWAYTQV